MEYTAYQTGQGLLTLYQGAKPTGWKISNKGGKWILYCVLDGRTHEYPFDFAPLIHDRQKLNEKLNEMLFTDA